MSTMNVPDGGGGVSTQLADLLGFLQRKLGGLYFDNPGTPPQDKAWVNLIRLRALFENTGSEALQGNLLKEQQGQKLVTIHDLVLAVPDNRLKESVTVLFGQKGTASPNVNQDIGAGDGRAPARALVDAQWTQMEGAGGVEAVSPAQPQQDPTGVLAPEQEAGADVDAIRADHQQGLAGTATPATPAPSGAGTGTGGGGDPHAGHDHGSGGGVNPDGTPRQIPGGAELWQVDSGAVYLAYVIPGTDRHMVWHVENPDRLKAIYGDAVPTFDRSLSRAEFNKLSPWLGGLSAELRNTDEEPWQQFMSDFNQAAELRPWLKDPTVQAVMAVAYLEERAPTSDELSTTDWWNEHTADERAWMEESATLGTAEVERRRDDASAAVAQTLREAGMGNVPKHVADYIAEQRLTGKWSEQFAGEQVRKLVDPFAPGTLDRGLLAALRDPGMGSAADARAIAGGKPALIERIRDIFENARVPIGTEGESEQARLDRIATEVLGGRTLTDVRQSVDLLALKTSGGRPGGLDTTRAEEDTVEALLQSWVGPHAAKGYDAAWVSEWAGRLRNDDDAEQELVEILKGARMANLPGWENENLRYADIAPIARSLFNQVWGVDADESDPLFLDVLNMQDRFAASQKLRSVGRERGVDKVVQDALSGLAATSLGDQVVRSQF